MTTTATECCTRLLSVGRGNEDIAEPLISKLQKFPLESIGSKEWLQQHAALERLSVLLHEEAVNGGPEKTQRLFCEAGKVSVLIEELITLDVWKEKVLPLLRGTADLSSVTAYLPVYHEGLLASILETLLFHSAAAHAADAQLPDLVEYCNRKLQKLLLRKTSTAADFGRRSAALEAAPLVAAKRTPEDLSDLQERQESEASFAAEMCALTLLRFIFDNRKSLQMTIMTLMLDQYDVLLTLIALLEHQPWRRQTSTGEHEVYEEQQYAPALPAIPVLGSPLLSVLLRLPVSMMLKGIEETWKTVERGDVRISKAEAQVWLTIYGLIMDPDCRQRYELTNFRKENLLRLRRHLNEVLYDQIPPLRDLHRYLEELSLGCTGSLFTTPKSALLISVQPEMREHLLQEHSHEWEALAATARRHLCSNRTEDQQQALRGIADVIQAKIEMVIAKCRRCGRKATKRCSRCRFEAYCSKECQQADWSVHRHTCKPAVAPTAAGGKGGKEEAGAAEEGAGSHVKGS
ncbi:zinc finger mynd domain protein [Cyclospora cayetanensis]|uniref:Zinc finger mynd domain protein n=1 Tax=Cyclospora cayetanensis TaxID=88456 RepID=A0A1D3D7B9_9EIME|nr:zinc finger mynd domain protein [Cyclospora cayetanensis]